MAYAHVRSSSTFANAAASSSSGSFGVLPTVGNFVAVGISMFRGPSTPRSIARVTDNQSGNFYQEDIEDTFSTAESCAAIWSTPVKVSSGTYTMTVTPVAHGTTDHYIAWGAAEFSGLGGANMPYFVGAAPGGPQTYSSVNTGTITRTVTAGSIWVVVLTQELNGSRSYTCATTGLTWNDTIGGTNTYIEGSVNNAEIHLWYAYDSAGGSRTATITVGASLNSSFTLYDFELSGINTSTPGDVAANFAESGTNTSHAFGSVSTSSNCGLGIAVVHSESGNINYVEPAENNGWSKLVGGDNASKRVILARLSYGSVSDTCSISHTTARQCNGVLAWFKAASAAVAWADKSGTNENASGDANVTATAANVSTGNLVLAVAAVSNADADINIGDTPPTNYANISVYEDANAVMGHSFVYKICTAGETSSASWTHDNTSQNGWNAVMRTYRDDTGAGSGTNISPTAANLVLSSTAPIDPRVAHLPAAGQGNLALSTTAPSRVVDHLPAAAAANLVISASAPTVLQAHLPAPPAGNLVLSGTAPADPRVAHLATPAAATLALSSAAPTVQQDHPVAPAAGNLVLSTTAPSLGGAISISPDAANLVLSTSAPSRLLDHLILAAAASLVLSTTAPEAPTQAHLRYPAQANLALSATAPVAPTQAHVRYPSAGNLVLSTAAPDLGGAVNISPSTGNLVLSSTAPDRLEASLRLPARADLVLSTTAPTVTIASGISPATAELALSTTAPTATQAHLAYPSAAALTLSPTAPSLDAGITPAQGQLALSTTAPDALQAHLRYPGQGSLVLTGVAPDVQGGAIQWTVYGVGAATRVTGLARAVRVTGAGLADRLSGLARAVRRET